MGWCVVAKTDRPKPLVQVYKVQGEWRRDCRRCHNTTWDQHWSEIIRDANEHAEKHTGVGFGPAVFR